MTERLTAAGAAKRVSRFRSFSSGSTAIDRLLGGGYRAGKTIEIFGESNTGKTQLAMQAALMVARQGSDSLFIDTEASFRPERLEEMAIARGWDPGPLLSRISYLRVDTSAEQMETVRHLAKRKQAAYCRLVVVDTLTRNFTLDFPGSGNTPRRQGSLEVHLSEIARDSFLNERAYLLANRVTFSDDKKDVHIGGQTLTQMVDSSVHLTKEGGAIKAALLGPGGRSETCKILPSGFD